MKKQITILIADKNSNVVSFLERELIEEGYRILTAHDTQAYMNIINSNDKHDILIIDPVLPGGDACTLIEELKKQNADVPVIIHAYKSDFYDCPAIMKDAFFIEKDGGSIEYMQKVISAIINNRESLKKTNMY